LLFAFYQVNGHPLICSTIHCEQDNRKTRELQLMLMEKIVAPFSNVVIAGDFGFDSTINLSQLLERRSTMSLEELKDLSIPYPPDEKHTLENDDFLQIFSRDKKWIDVWPFLHPELKGHTFDSQINEMIGDFVQMRYDRIVFKSELGHWLPTSIALLGNAQIGKEETELYQDPLFPSNHFGLQAEITWNQQ